MSIDKFSIENFFPIYDVISDQVKASGDYDKAFSTEEYITLINKLGKVSLDKRGKEMIYILTKTHSIRNTNTSVVDIPFGGEKINEKEDNKNVGDVKFDIRNFPNSLNRILMKFADLHLRKINEDSEKTKFSV